MRRTRVDHSPRECSKLPPVPPSDLILFHWSPTKNRARINHDGLVPGSLSLQGDWRPPYVCYSDDPILAWQLSGRMYPEIEEWDLWMFNLDNQDSIDHYELITDTYVNSGRSYIKEYRIYQRVYKRDIVLLGTRKT